MVPAAKSVWLLMEATALEVWKEMLSRAVHRAQITVNLPGMERFGLVRLRNHSTHHESENYGNYQTELLKYGRHAGGMEKI